MPFRLDKTKADPVRSQARAVARERLAEYVHRPNHVTLTLATEAVRQYRTTYGPLTACGFGWSLNGAGELFKWRTRKEF